MNERPLTTQSLTPLRRRILDRLLQKNVKYININTGSTSKVLIQ